MEFRDGSLGFRVQGSGFRVERIECRVENEGCKTLGLRVMGSVFRVKRDLSSWSSTRRRPFQIRANGSSSQTRTPESGMSGNELCSRFESLILSHHSGFCVTFECNEEDDDGERALFSTSACLRQASISN